MIIWLGKWLKKVFEMAEWLKINKECDLMVENGT